MTILVIVELKVKGQHENEMFSFFSDRLPETRLADGNQGVTIHKDKSDSSSVILIERWRSKHDYENYSKWRSNRGDLTTLAKFLANTPLRRYFEILSM